MRMTVKKIVDGLYFTVGMMLFNPITGESKTPDELNEDDRTTYDACMGAIDMLKAQEPVEPMRKQGKHGWFFYCQKCKTILNDMAKPKYCSECGQAVKWDG